MIPIRSQLSAAVFAKTMRKKDVKGTQQEDEKEPAEETGSSKSDEDEDELKNMKQGTINLLSVDAERIALFTALSNILIESLVGTTYGFAFIWIMLGWESLLAGLLVVILTSPFNIYFSKLYSDAQEDLMKVRDRKMGVISEALQGIRQIKFSAQEARWEEKIRQVREEELKTLRRVFMADVYGVLPVPTSAFIANGIAGLSSPHGSSIPSSSQPCLSQCMPLSMAKYQLLSPFLP
jgi:ABC-type multidrug transport system fused ATPase/permease subunit